MQLFTQRLLMSKHGFMSLYTFMSIHSFVSQRPIVSEHILVSLYTFMSKHPIVSLVVVLWSHNHKLSFIVQFFLDLTFFRCNTIFRGVGSASWARHLRIDYRHFFKKIFLIFSHKKTASQPLLIVINALPITVIIELHQ